MKINAAFDKPAFVHSDELDWLASPMKGVDRKMLDRVGEEVARATSIVRYAKGSSFSEHTHSGGEEFIVLEGVFQDEHDDYPQGTYVRNPVGTHHIPRSEPGCTIFVKLWQFDSDDQEQIAIDLNDVELSGDGDRVGVMQATLAERDYELVALEEWQPGVSHRIQATKGIEILVLDGELAHDGITFAKHDWLRFPGDETARLTAGSQGVRFWIKRGHLAQINVPQH